MNTETLHDQRLHPILAPPGPDTLEDTAIEVLQNSGQSPGLNVLAHDPATALMQEPDFEEPSRSQTFRFQELGN